MKVWTLLLLVISISCSTGNKIEPEIVPDSETYLMVLGNVQDAGSPQAGCKKECCRELWIHPDSSRMVASLALVSRIEEKVWFFDATPDFAKQWSLIQSEVEFPVEPAGIFLTHAHIGHYTGLMFLGKESVNSREVPVYVYPRMNDFLSHHAPWEALVKNRNILLMPLNRKHAQSLSVQDMEVRSILVPHRDEYSETAAFIIKGPNKTALFIPDIDKWEKWEMNIDSLISTVDYAFIDGTFYNGEEIQNRDLKSIPHPFISESMARFEYLSPEIRNRIYFIHLNHSNPALNPKSPASVAIQNAGFNVAGTGMKIPM